MSSTDDPLSILRGVSKTKSFALSAPFLVSCFVAMGENAAPTPPLSSLGQKKLIEYGWDTQTPAFIAEHIREMEKRPFDGLIFRLAGGTDVLDPKPWNESRFAADLEAIPKIEWKTISSPCWSLRMKIGKATNTTAADMYVPRPAPPFRVNLARERSPANEYSSWAPVAKSFFETGNSGTWKFK